MTIPDVADQYFAYEDRLASFQTAQSLSKRRASNASTKAPKTLKWPHKFLSPEELAKAGFFFHPLQSNPDNVACFLCHKQYDGWEEDDDPLAEHLKHSPDCGWAVVASVEKQDGDLSEEYPLSTRMIDARKATFGDRWPHEEKKGWKCKTKQMVDAGWKYTPCAGSDDMATCAYCALALDGWEKSDKPLDEHHNRSPGCPFFVLISSHKQTPKRNKFKKDRTSKASRFSTQSALAINSEAPSIIDLPAEEEDSVLTTATNATAKRMVKPKKTAATKGKKTRAKKDEPVEVTEAPEPEDDDFEIKVDLPEPTRGRKRKSEHQEELVEPAVETEVPPPKRRATRTRGSTAVDNSLIGESEPLPKVRGKKGRTSRKPSAASQALLHGPVPNDDEIDRALEADLEKPLEEEAQQPRSTKAVNSHYSIFSAEAIDINEAEIEAELDAMEVDSKPLPKPKKGKAAPTRKVSAKQRAAAKKAAEAEAEAEAQRIAEEEASQQIAAELEQSISIQHYSPILPPKKQRASTKQPSRPLPPLPTQSSVMPVNDDPVGSEDEAMGESGNETDASMASQSTVIRGGSTRRGSALKKGKGGKKGPSRNIEEIVHKPKPSMLQVVEPARASKNNHLQVEDVSNDEDRFYTPAPEAPPPVIQDAEPKVLKTKAAKLRGRAAKFSDASTPRQAIPDIKIAEINKEPTPAKAATPAHRSPTPPPKELTPSQSPNSSDAENQPPSSKPSAASKRPISTPRSTAKRVPLADATPTLSPSKRNVIAGLRTDEPWTSIDLDTIFMKSPSGENSMGKATDIFGGAAERIKAGDLTSPEKKMTVEEWIHYNAQVAEEKLRNECERMVGTFESQGTRAMRALEGIECLE